MNELKKSISNHAKPHHLIIADSAEPRLIEEIKRSDLNIKKAEKPDGSVIAGIRLIQDYDIITDKESINFVKELRNYTWNDKKSGIPNDSFNHLLDALRYFVQATTRRTESHQKWHF